MGGIFRPADICELTGLSPAYLRVLRNRGLIKAFGKSDERTGWTYTLQDALVIAVAQILQNFNIPARYSYLIGWNMQTDVMAFVCGEDIDPALPRRRFHLHWTTHHESSDPWVRASSFELQHWAFADFSAAVPLGWQSLPPSAWLTDVSAVALLLPQPLSDALRNTVAEGC